MIPLTASTFMVDNSMLDLITRCPWLGYASVLRRRRLSDENPALRFGGFVHEVIAHGYRRRCQDLPQAQVETEQIVMLHDLFSAFPMETEGWRNVLNAVKLIRAYNAHYVNELTHSMTIVNNPLTGAPYIEQPFAIDTHKIVRGRRIIYCGKIDLKIQISDGTQYTMDHKTTSVLGDRNFWESEAVSAQHPGYIWADREACGHEATGFIVNALGCRESIQNAEYDADLGVVVPGMTQNGKQSKAVPVEFQRQRFFTQFPQGQIDDWFENMIALCDRFLYNVDDNVFPRHRAACVGKYGLCPMYEVCALPPTSREDALKSARYTENTWTPLYTGKPTMQPHIL